MTVGPSDEHTDAGSRLRRLLGLLAYLARVKEASIAELAQRFAMDEATVVSELELAACCGLPPYTPDQLLELVIDGDRVHAYGLEALRRPPRLTPDEGFALAAAARVILGVDPDATSPLRSALHKLEAALGSDRVAVELDHPEHLGALRRAAIEGEAVELDYLGAHRGEESRRVVEPYAVVALEGHFYLDAFCRLAGDWRRFQIDRVTAVRPTGEPVAPRTLPLEFAGARAFVGGASVTRVRLSVPNGRQLLLERVAAGPFEPDGPDRSIVAVDVADAVWFGLLLLRLGAEVEVVDAGGLADARRVAAARVLARYRASDATKASSTT